MVTRRTLLGRILAGGTAVALSTGPVARAIAAPEPEGIQITPGVAVLDDAALVPQPPVVAWEAKIVMVGFANSMHRECGREASLTAHTDGSGRLTIARIVNESRGHTDRDGLLFGDALPFTVIDLHPDELRSVWLGLFAESIDEPVPGVIAA